VQREFPQVPGPDSEPLARWALRSGVERSGLDSGLLTRAAEVTLEAAARSSADDAQDERPLPSGVNLVGYLAGEVGLGESARLVDEALQAAGVATSTHDVSHRIRSRRGAGFRKSAPVTFDTTLLCVNGAETDVIAPQIADLLRRTRVIGMWYWELEDFPALHRVGFRHVDEVWAATDFMREAIAKHAGEIPVRTVTPPLPQAADDPGVLPERYRIPPDRPWFLFTFDFLSQATRKNPFGLVDAFTRAFQDRPVDQRPLLVIKTINAVHYPADAERLRLQILGRDDVRFIDEYLPNDQRHVLVSHCTAFVSLHKAEGLGLTVAEAMAWGKPVITTAYGGVMQFCNTDNAFLVDWARGYVEETVGPYEQGRPWAEPDLEQAAAFMRVVVDDPERARALGTQAAKDIRELHNAETAGAHMREVLEQGAREWTGKQAQRPVSSSPETRAPLAAQARRRVGASWRRWRDRSA
jgi:glycosyltransferase involved in cell wall biosynthesis